MWPFLSHKVIPLTDIFRDGTLLTHRFHFAPWEHGHRHIYGWYRLITELRDNEIQAICVFDGDHRTEAKSAEVRGD